MKRILFYLTASLLALATITQVSAATLSSQKDRLSYAIGMETGKAFRAQHIQVNTAAFAKGLQDGLSNNKALMTSTQIKQTLLAFQKKAFAKMQNKLKQLADTNLQQGIKFLNANKTKPGIKTTASGLQYKILKAGNGPKPTASDMVTVDYEGKLINGKVFDSSYKRGTPTSFPVNAVIPGWTEALQMMPVGSTWKLFIPAKLAYGTRGAPGTIGPNEVLIFKVHLRGIKK